MHGKIVYRENDLYVETLSVGEELDSVEKTYIKVLNNDTVYGIGQEVQFDIISFDTIDGLQLAKIRK